MNQSIKLIACLLLLPVLLAAQRNPVELGDIRWLRSWDEARARSQKEQKPVLILFQEIPGCATCQRYGSEVLTHPLLVEAIETLFVPLAIHNNKGGSDAEVLKRYNEPSWNNPVVRVVDENGENIVTRLSGNYSPSGLANTLVSALVETQGSVPAYLRLLSDELTAEQHGIQKVTYSMYCFWSGEKLFGKLNGVVKTTAGYQNGKEVVSVEYNPRIISKDQLDGIADTQQCHIESGNGFRADSTPKYYLSHSNYCFIPMTEIQKCRVNSALGEQQSPDEFLSPRQLAVLNSNNNVNCVELSLRSAWGKVSQ